MQEERTVLDAKVVNGGLLLHEALIATLYADRIRFDKELRHIVQSDKQSLAIFEKDVSRYVDMYPTVNDIKQDAKSRVAGFFQEVDRILKDMPDET